MMEVMEELLTTAEVAAILKVHPATISRMAKSGKIRAFKIPGGRYGEWRIPKSEIEKFFPARRQNQ